MLLHYSVKATAVEFENPPTIILLHGLFGMGANLGAVATALAEQYRVVSMDLRNHGRSPWSQSMSIAEMAEDVLETIDEISIDRIFVLGHSLGGKVAMQLALQNPDRVQVLIVADIAPVAYSAHHIDIFKGLNAIDLRAISSRRDADNELQKTVDDAGVRQFLLKNLYRDSSGNFSWRMNVLALEECYGEISGAVVAKQSYSGPTLFIKGEKSDYIRAEHWEIIVDIFPAAKIKIIHNTGHWLHAEKPVAFNRIVKNFISEHG